MASPLEYLELIADNRCNCRHKAGQHERYVGSCTNCNCGEFVYSLVNTEKANELIGACVTPGTTTPTHNVSSQAVPVDDNRGSTVPDSGLKDSGMRLTFDSGMVRDIDDTKPAFDLVIPEGIPYEELMLTRWAELLRKGAIKYAKRNWEKADSKEELDRAKASAFRHFMQWFSGENDEDHAAAVFFNINEVETIKYKQKGTLNASGSKD